MADANLLEILKKIGKRAVLEDMVVFGRVRCAIQQPEMLKGLKTAPGFFAIIDAYALKCLGEDYFSDSGIYDVNRIYFTKGSMVIFVDSKKWIGKDVKVYGSNTRRGVKIKQQWNISNPNEGIIALQFMRDNSGNFVVSPNKLVELCDKDTDTRGTVLEDFMVSVNLQKDGVINYPVTLDSIISYEGCSNYVELKDEEIEENEKSFKSSDGKIDVSKIDLKLVHHLKGAEKSYLYDDFVEEVKGMSNKRQDYSESEIKFIGNLYNCELDDNFDYSEIGYKGKGSVLNSSEVHADIRNRFIGLIASKYYDTCIGSSKLCGSYYVNELLNEITEGNLCPLESGEKKANLREEVSNLAQMVMVEPDLLYGYGGFDNIDLLNSSLDFALAVVGMTTGIGIDTIANHINWCSRYNKIDKNIWFYTMLRYPYLLGLIGPGISLVDCDVLYFSYSRYYSKGCLSDENMDLRSKLLFLETLNNADNKDSITSEWELKSRRGKYPSLGERYLNKFGFPAKEDVVEVLRVLLHQGIVMSKPQVEGIKNIQWYSEDRKNELIECGLVNTVDDDLVLESDLEKEFLIYKVLIEKGKKGTGLDNKVIAETIEEFEASRGFQLEKLQKDGILLTKFRAAVLSGCAGSGKTTTSDCMTEALKKLPDFDENYELIYCTPTGKACRRLAEVVKCTVRTIHSQFGVGLGGSSYMAPVKMMIKNTDKTKIYLMDEMAMCSMPLLYEICRKLSENDIIYFLGDIKQLPPIGKGNPFALLMKILPCVELGVSKRAAEGSGVNYNTTLINCMSDGVIQELSYNNKDFFCVECSDAMIPMTVSNVWRDFMNGKMNGKQYKEDDIQVITGYQKEDIIFSAPQLNKPLQKLLRANDRFLFRHTNRDFYKNERVIHLKLNSYSMNRYVEIEPGTYQVVATFGIVNGEVGKLIDIQRSDMINIVGFDGDSCVAGEDYYKNVSEETLEELIKKREERGDDFRDDSRIHNSRQYFVRVRVWDVELGMDVFVMYVATARMADGVTVLEGTDLGCLDLAYALSTHKMQGSQSPVVICPFGSTCNPRFINRNMINTMFTRSQEVVCNVGMVKGEDSPINKGRQFVSPVTCKDVLSVLVEES